MANKAAVKSVSVFWWTISVIFLSASGSFSGHQARGKPWQVLIEWVSGWMSECSFPPPSYQLLKWSLQDAGHGTLQCYSSSGASNFTEEQTKAQRRKWWTWRHSIWSGEEYGLERKATNFRQGSSLHSIVPHCIALSWSLAPLCCVFEVTSVMSGTFRPCGQ